ncbi:very short patch repair endonuclease [Arthrobacter ramosus]|uniref:Very short patch repair endonuclease n=1 Tax=Arthrobacter ramosus TaxID=1672 RepID=A0ABV5Y0P8_ARTRM|nr:very short patch repair endonuclease [Arthrobacter ramosus]
MADFMTAAQRSAHMAKIRSKNTKPELQLRRVLHAAGFRYRLHDPALPGRPDLVFAGRRKVIFVNGCFWHGHDCPVGRRLPKSNTDFWADKRRRNQARDTAQRLRLTEMGWTYLDVWECEVAENANLVVDVAEFLECKAVER